MEFHVKNNAFTNTLHDIIMTGYLLYLDIIEKLTGFFLIINVYCVLKLIIASITFQKQELGSICSKNCF